MTLSSPVYRLRKARILLPDVLHLSVIAERCPNLELLVLGTLRDAPVTPFGRMMSIGKFSNLVILQTFCDLQAVPPFSKLTKLRELVLSTNMPFLEKWCRAFAGEVPKSVRFLSLYLSSVKCSKILLDHLQLTVLRVKCSRSNFQEFCDTFPVPHNNPTHLFVNDLNSFLVNGQISSQEPVGFGKRFLSYP